MEADPAILDLTRGTEPELPLAAWYGEPLSPEQALALERQAGDCLRRRHAPAGPPLRCRLQWLVARFWLGRDIEAEAANLLAVHTDAASRALVLLVHGQLLASVRQQGAMAHLDAGFALAAAHLEPEAYFRLLKRHDALRDLPWRSSPAQPQGLESLLREAAVIRRLRGPRKARPRGSEGAHLDTLD